MERRIQKTDMVVNRVKRIPIVIFLKRISPVLFLLLLLYLSILFGLWNIRNIEFNEKELKYISEEELESYVYEFLEENIFLLRPSVIEEKILKSNGYVEEVYVKKILPGKLDITIKEYTPIYLGYSSETCMLFADSGEKVLEVCKECSEECSTDSWDTALVYITSESALESGERLIFFEEIHMIQKVLSTFKYDLVNISINNGIAKITDIHGHEFVFDLSYELDIQLSRMYLVGQKVDRDMIKFKSLDLRFERPVMKLK